ncbi:MAG: ketopantoate reductase family protein [Clostridium sp.]|nr:ketopantoate reductase family protein [Clostridium sp.]
MKSIKKVLICGLGAIGSIYAVKISRSKDIELKILADKTRIEKYKKQPLVFNNEEYLFDYILPQTRDFIADLVIIATKNNALDSVVKNLKNFVAEDTIIISLLNGLKSENVLSEIYGESNILYSYYIGHTSTRNDRNIIHDDVYKTVFGEKNNGVYSKNVILLKDFFEKVNINYEIPLDMEYSRWWKFLVNVGYNQASAVLNASYGDFQNVKSVNQLAVKLMQETVEVAKAEGVKNTEKMIPEVLNVIKTMLPDTRTSMLQDVDAKRQTEVDIFAGYVSELGKKHNIPTPYNNIFLEIIKAIDEKNL